MTGARRAGGRITPVAEPTIQAAAEYRLERHADTGAGESGPMLVWRFSAPVRTISSGMVGGGIDRAEWIINAHVRADYRRMDPGAHLRQIALDIGLDADRGAGLLTAARVDKVATALDGGVRADATVGISYPTLAAAPDDDPLPDRPWLPGTINIVCQLPVPLTDAALVGAVITATEAKAQALAEAAVPGTGTASDAIVICCPIAEAAAEAAEPATGLTAGLTAGPVPFAGPRSVWGARLARAVHRAVGDGLRLGSREWRPDRA